MKEVERCSRCERALNPDRVVMLELNCDDLTLHPPGEVPEDQSQGCFPFGPECAKRAIRWGDGGGTWGNG